LSLKFSITGSLLKNGTEDDRFQRRFRFLPPGQLCVRECVLRQKRMIIVGIGNPAVKPLLSRRSVIIGAMHQKTGQFIAQRFFRIELG